MGIRNVCVLLLVIIEPGTIHRVIRSYRTFTSNSQFWANLDFTRNSGTDP